MKEVIEKIVGFYKENCGTRWLIKDIIQAVLFLTVPIAATIIGLVLHLTWLVIVGAILYFVSTLCLIINMIKCLYFAIETAEEADDILYGDDDEEDTTETKIVFRIGDQVRALRDGISYGKGAEGFVKDLDNSTPTGWESMKVNFINPGVGKLPEAWVDSDDFELVDHKEDAQNEK